MSALRRPPSRTRRHFMGSDNNLVLGGYFFFLPMLYGLNQGLMNTPGVKHKGKRIKMEIRQNWIRMGTGLKKRGRFHSFI